MRLPNRTLERIKECFRGIPDKIAKSWTASIYGYKTWPHMVAEIESFKGVPTPDDEDVSVETWNSRWERQLAVLVELSEYSPMELVPVVNRISATSREGKPRLSEKEQAQELIPRGLQSEVAGGLADLLDDFAKMAGLPVGGLPRHTSKHPSIAEKLKKEGPTMEAVQFFTAMERGNHGEALTIIQARPAFKDAISERGMTALTAAVEADAREVVKELLKAGANPNVQDSDGFTALIEGSRRGNPWAVSQLLAAGADPDCRTVFGWTPLLTVIVGDPLGQRPALEKDNVNAVVKMLLDAGADPYLSNIAGMTPAELADQAPGLDPEVVKRLKVKPKK